MAQDSPLGQPITGFRGVDAPLNLLGMLTALKSGQLGNQLASFQHNRQAAQLEPAKAEEQQLKNTDLRNTLLNDPGIREQLRLQGPTGPVAQTLGLQGPAIPARAVAQFNPDNTTDYYQGPHAAEQGLAPGMPGDTPHLMPTTRSAENALKQAQAAALTSASSLDPTARPPGIPADWTLQQTVATPGKPARYTWAAPVQGIQNEPAGTLKGPGQQYQGGEVVGGKTVAITPGPNGGSGGDLATNLKRAMAARDSLKDLAVPIKAGNGEMRAPGDIFPDFSEGGAGMSVYGIPVPNAIGRTVGGKMHMPGGPEDYTTSEAYVDNIRNDKSNPYSPQASKIATARGQVGQMLRGMGEGSRVAQQELNRVLNAFIPALGDSPGPTGSAAMKINNGVAAFDRIVTAMQQGQIKTPADLQGAVNSYLSTVNQPPVDITPDPTADNTPFSAAPTAGAPAARTGGANTPGAADAALDRLRRGAAAYQ